MIVNRKREITSKEQDDQRDSKEGILSESVPGTSTPPRKRTVSSQSNSMFWISVAAYKFTSLSCFVLVVYWCTLYGGFSWNSDPHLQFFVHPACMVLGLILFYGDVIIVDRILSFIPNLYVKWIKAFLSFSACVLSGVGLVAIFRSHQKISKPNFTSLHSWMGVVTLGLFCLTAEWKKLFDGIITFLFPGLSRTLRSKSMPYHPFVGYTIFLMAVATALTGLTERLKWTEEYTSGNLTEKTVVGNTLGLFLILFAGLVFFFATNSQFKRKKLPRSKNEPIS